MFDIKKRGNDDIVIFNDKATEKLKNSVFEAHGDRLPEDWIFDKYHSILSNICEYDDVNNIDDLEDIRGEIVDGLVDVYTSNLTQWLNYNINNVYYLTEAQEEYGAKVDGFEILQSAQYKAIDDIFSYVSDLLSK